MKIENIAVYGFEHAFRGMRNPGESWSKSDSNFQNPSSPVIGPKDLKLALSLIKGGVSHRKFLRQIMVWVDLTLPRAIWAEIDTYKVSTVRNSCSTMYKLGTRALTVDDFENGEIMPEVLAELNRLGEIYRAQSRNTKVLHELKMKLPESFLQKSTYMCSYENLLNMYQFRRDHRMPEWSGPGGLCEWIKSLPYMDQFLITAFGF